MAEKASKARPQTPPVVKIDLEDIDQRILALPLPPRNYVDLQPGKDGVLFIVWRRRRRRRRDDRRRSGRDFTLHKFDLDKRKAETVRGGAAAGPIVSADGEKLLYRAGSTNGTSASTSAAPKPGEGGARSRPTTSRFASIRAPNGSRCTAKSGASNAISSTIRTSTAMT